MKIYYIGVFRNDPKPAHELCAVNDLSSFSFFQRGTVAEFLTFFSTNVAERTAPAQRQDIQEQSYTFHVYGRSEGCAGVIISDHEYPKLVAHKLLTQVMDDFLTLHPRAKWATGAVKLDLPSIQDYITKYQDPKQADSILKIQQELDETKIVLHKTIESVLERGTKIENLVERSEGLSAQSKLFYTQAKKQNSCCVIS